MKSLKPFGQRNGLGDRLLAAFQHGQDRPVLRVLHVALRLPRSFASPPRRGRMTPPATTTRRSVRRYAEHRTPPEPMFANSARSRSTARKNATHHNTSISSSMTLRTLRAVKLSSLILGYFAIAASAAGAVECPDDSDAVTTYAVDYARASTGFEVSMYGGPVGADGEPYDIDASRITSPSVSVNGVPTPLVFNDVGVASAILSSPQVKTATVIFTWTQDAGTPMACDGRDVYRFPVIPRGAKAGDTSVSRLSGVYRVAWRSLSADRSSLTPSRWTIRPACQYFACDLRVRSNGDMGRARFVLNAKDDTYRFLREHFGRQGWCATTNVFTGVRRRVEPAYLVSARVTIRPRRAVNGVAREFTGKWTDSYSRLKRARDIQCSTPSDTEWRVTAKRIAP